MKQNVILIITLNINNKLKNMIKSHFKERKKIPKGVQERLINKMCLIH